MLEDIFKSLPDAILIVGRDGRIQQVNARAGQLFGYNHSELLGLDVEALMPEHLSQQHVQNRVDYFNHPHIRPMGSGLDLFGRRKDGSEFPVDITLGPLGEKWDAVVCAVRDITEQRQLMNVLAEKNAELHNMTQQLWQTAKLATMGELAASIAHELNNPLGIVSLRVESLQTGVAPDDPKSRPLKIIAEEIDRMSNLVSNLLNFSRKQVLQVSTLDIREELDRTIELIHYHMGKHEISVNRNFPVDILSVQADRQSLRQLFLNVLTNANDAMSEGGTLTITVSAEESRVNIEIKDTGKGIEPEDLPRIMESFYTTKSEGSGTGLGLSICKRIVEEHNGMFNITSPGPGQGTTVHISLPCSKDSPGSQFS